MDARLQRAAGQHRQPRAGRRGPDAILRRSSAQPRRPGQLCRADAHCLPEFPGSELLGRQPGLSLRDGWTMRAAHLLAVIACAVAVDLALAADPPPAPRAARAPPRAPRQQPTAPPTTTAAATAPHTPPPPRHRRRGTPGNAGHAGGPPLVNSVVLQRLLNHTPPAKTPNAYYTLRL